MKKHRTRTASGRFKKKAKRKSHKRRARRSKGLLGGALIKGLL